MRRAVSVAVILVAVLLLAALALPFLIDVNHFRPAVESAISNALGRKVTIGNLKLSLWSGTLGASDLSVADDPAFGQSAFLRAKSLTLSVDVLPAVFSRKLHVDGVSIESPEAVLTQAASGMWNFSSLGVKTTAAPAAPAPSQNTSEDVDVSVKSVRIHNARITLSLAGAKAEIVDSVNGEVTDFAPKAVSSFSLSGKAAGGAIALSGKVGPVDAADTARTPFNASVKITGLNLTALGTAVLPGIAGVVSTDGTVASNGTAVQVAAKVKAEQLKLLAQGTVARNPLTLDVALSEEVERRAGKVSRGDFAIGSVKGGLTGTWSGEGDATTLNMTLAAPNVPVSGLEELLPVLDIVLPAGSKLQGGTASANLTMTGPTSAIVMAGPVSVRGTQLQAFDLGTKMSQIAALAGIRAAPTTRIEILSANVRIAPEGTSLQDIHLDSPDIGELTGSGIIGPSHTVNFAMRASVHRTAVISTLAPSVVAFTVTGTASDPQFRLDVGQLATQEIKQRLKGIKVGGVDAGAAADSVLQGLFGGKKKK